MEFLIVSTISTLLQRDLSKTRRSQRFKTNYPICNCCFIFNDNGIFFILHVVMNETIRRFVWRWKWERNEILANSFPMNGRQVFWLWNVKLDHKFKNVCTIWWTLRLPWHIADSKYQTTREVYFPADLIVCDVKPRLGSDLSNGGWLVGIRSSMFHWWLLLSVIWVGPSMLRYICVVNISQLVL